MLNGKLQSVSEDIYDSFILREIAELTEGNFGTTMISYMILKTVRESSPPAYGEAQAQAVIFFVIIAVISIAQVMITKRKEIES